MESVPFEPDVSATAIEFVDFGYLERENVRRVLYEAFRGLVYCPPDPYLFSLMGCAELELWTLSLSDPFRLIMFLYDC